MNIPQQFFAAKFTANARNIAAFIAICLAAYGLTMLNWLETNQQRDVQLNPREEAPDFLVTNARYLDFKPSLAQDAKNMPQEGLLRLDIQSKTLSHYADTKTTIFQKPIAQFLDKNDQTWLITSDTAISSAAQTKDMSNQQASEKIQLQKNVTLTALSHSNISMDAEDITIDTTNETLETTSKINMDFQGGNLSAGGFQTSVKTGKVRFNSGVQATYYPQGSSPQ